MAAQFILTDYKDALEDPKAKNALPIISNTLLTSISTDNNKKQITKLLLLGLSDSSIRQDLEPVIRGISHNDLLEETSEVKQFFGKVVRSFEESQELRSSTHATECTTPNIKRTSYLTASFRATSSLCLARFAV